MNFNKKKSLHYALLISYSLSLILIWGLGLLHDIAGSLTIFLTFLFTAYSLILFKREKKLEKTALLLAPAIYFIAALIIKDIDVFVKFPIAWIFILFIVGLFFGKIKSIVYHIFVLSFSILYAFVIYPHRYDTPSLSYEEVTESQIKIREGYNLHDFRFITIDSDTLSVVKNGKPYLIETWNETCRPCISSIRDLQDTLSSDTTFNHIYVYQARGNKKLDTKNIFAFKVITDKKKIVIDLENNLFKSLELKSYPYFLIFDKDGKLVDYTSGYSSKYRSEVLEDLLTTIQKIAK